MTKKETNPDAPKVSVVVPVYNTGKYVVRCLQSIESQSFEDYEVLIVNDGSTDNSEEICRDFIKGKAKFRVTNKQNGGLTSARLWGWKEAIGKYIVFVDSDDYIEPDYCKDLYNACEKSNSSLAICAYQVVADKGNPSVVSLPFSQDLITDIRNEYIKPLISYTPETKQRVPGFLWLRMMLREAITEDCFVDENKVFTEDVVFDLLYAQRVDRIAIVQRPLYNYYQSAGSLTHKYRPNLWGMYKNLHELCRLYCDKIELHNASHYLSTLLIGGALHATQQASACLEYAEFEKEFQSIRRDPMLMRVIAPIGVMSGQFKHLIINHEIIYLMLRFAHPKIVYHFYKWRQSR